MSVPLCVDLDGTLIKTDSLWESWLLLLKKNPLYLFLSFSWLFCGAHYFKRAISNRITLNPEYLPYSASLLTYLKEEFNKGRKLILVTAADKRIADAIAKHLGIFSAVYASDERTNLKGIKKQLFLNNLLGEKSYDYAGNAKIDLSIWSSARLAIIVNANDSLIKKASAISQIEKIFPRETHYSFSFLKALRIHHYIKNILVFVPLITSHLYYGLSPVVNSIYAFTAFCLLASSVYLANDLVDLEYDRQHVTKNKRTFAAGDLPILYGFFFIALFASLAFIIASTLNATFAWILVAYFLVSNAYSFYLKKQLLVDVFVLALLYTMRIIAGIAAIQCDYSEWLITFCLFFFLSLALLKRYSELLMTLKAQKTHIAGRGYAVGDLTQISIFGTVSGYVAVLVLALYINSSKVVTLYHHPDWLWLVCLLLLYWISRIWMLATRGLVREDPVVFTVTDKVSIFIGLLTAITVLLAGNA